MRGGTVMPETGRKVVFLGLQAIVAAEAIVLLYEGVNEFLAAAGGDATILFMSAILLMIGVTDLYLAYGLRSRGSSPFYAAVVTAFLAIVIVYAMGPLVAVRILGIVLAVAILVALGALRNRFQLRPGEFVKEEKLLPEVVSKISTRVRGVRCKECGDDDVWLTSDKLLVCRNCGSTDA
jgi:hypothetical protein